MEMIIMNDYETFEEYMAEEFIDFEIPKDDFMMGVPKINVCVDGNHFCNQCCYCNGGY